MTGVPILVRLALRRDRILLPVWILVIPAVVTATAAAIADLSADPGQSVLVGAENEVGAGSGLPVGTLPTEDLRVVSTDPTPGGSVTYTVKVRGLLPGAGEVTTEMNASSVPGTTVVRSPVKVKSAF